MTQHNYPLDDFPTDAPPGTAEKLEVMISRRKRGRHIFHPLDSMEPTEENVCVRLLVGGVRESNNRASGRTRRSRAKYHEPCGKLIVGDKSKFVSRWWEAFK